MSDFTQLIGKTINRGYIDDLHQNLILRCTDESWYGMSCPMGSPETVFFVHVIGVAHLFEAVVISVNVIDALNVSITTSKGITTFNTILFHPAYINGVLDLYPVPDVISYDDNQVVRSIFLSLGDYFEIVYRVMTQDI